VPAPARTLSASRSQFPFLRALPMRASTNGFFLLMIRLLMNCPSLGSSFIMHQARNPLARLICTRNPAALSSRNGHFDTVHRTSIDYINKSAICSFSTQLNAMRRSRSAVAIVPTPYTSSRCLRSGLGGTCPQLQAHEVPAVERVHLPDGVELPHWPGRA